MRKPRGRNRKIAEHFVAAGKVYLVGAGPGHPELLTVKAARLLAACDVVIYDRLIQQEVLALTKPSAERIYMGKKVGLHESRQEEICELLARKSREGGVVVRLKGGDPFLFGRGGEEAEFLAEQGIPFEVIPGVSAALAAPLSAGIAVTHRAAASSVAIVTGHEARDDGSRMNWQALAGIDTLVFLMAVHSVGRVASELIAHGRDPRTPAAMIQMAYWHGEKVVTGALENIAEEAERAGVSPPATLVVGEVVSLREKLRGAQRDLMRAPDAAAEFAPAPSPDQLLRLATAGVGSQVLLFSLTTGLFEHLEEWRASRDLARDLGMSNCGLAETLECLVSLGLLESGPAGYRNAEIASRYLLESSPQSLLPTLLALAAHLPPVSSIGRYVLDGCERGAPPQYADLQSQSCECLARYAAPFVLDNVDLSSRGRCLIVGWGVSAYRALAARRWPGLALAACNPFNGDAAGDTLGLPRPDGDSFGTILLSGLLPCCARNQFREILSRAVGLLGRGGQLLIHDAFVESAAPSPPELALSAYRRHVISGGSRNWSIERVDTELGPLGFQVVGNQRLPGGTRLIIAAAAPNS